MKTQKIEGNEETGGAPSPFKPAVGLPEPKLPPRYPAVTPMGIDSRPSMPRAPFTTLPTARFAQPSPFAPAYVVSTKSGRVAGEVMPGGAAVQAGAEGSAVAEKISKAMSGEVSPENVALGSALALRDEREEAALTKARAVGPATPMVAQASAVQPVVPMPRVPVGGPVAAVPPTSAGSGLSRETLDAPDTGVRTALLKRQLGQPLTEREARRLAVRAQVEESTAARGGVIAGGRGIAVETGAPLAPSPFSRAETRYTGPSIGDVTGETARRDALELAQEREQARVAEREADRADRKAYVEGTARQREAERTAMAEARSASAETVERLRREGRKFQKLPDGRIETAKNPDGSDQFEVIRDFKEPGGWLMSRNERGEVTRRRAPVKFGEDGEAVFDYGGGNTEPAGNLLDLAVSDDPDLKKVAEGEVTKRVGEARRAATQPIWNRVNMATVELESARAEQAEITKRIEALNTRIEAAKSAGLLEFGYGGVGDKLRGEQPRWIAKTPEGQAQVDELATLKAREIELNEATREDLRFPEKNGALTRARNGALAEMRAARETLRGGTLDAVIENRRRWLEQNGGKLEGDEVLTELEKAGRKLGLRRASKPGAFTGPRPFNDGPQGWDEVDQGELDAGPKAEPALSSSSSSPTPAATAEPEPGEVEDAAPDEVGKVLEWHGLSLPEYADPALRGEVEAGLRQILRGETLANLDSYSRGGERARGLFGNAVKLAEAQAKAKLREGAR